MFLRFFFIVLLATSYLRINSQSIPYQIFTKDDGLPSNFIYRVIEDSKGFIWISSEAGVSKFDGQTFTNYGVEDGIPNNDVYKVIEDCQDRIWFMNNDQQLSYIKNDTIKSFDIHDDRYITHVSHNGVYTYFATKDSFYRIDTSDHVVTYSIDDDDNPEALKFIIETIDNLPNFNREDLITNRNIGYCSGMAGSNHRDSLIVLNFGKKEVYGRQLETNPNAIIQDFVVQKSRNSTDFQIYYDNELKIYNRELELLDSFDFNEFYQYNINSGYIDQAKNMWLCTSEGLIYIDEEAYSNKMRYLPEWKGFNIGLLSQYGENAIASLEDGSVYIDNKNKPKLLAKRKQVSGSSASYDLEVYGDQLFFSHQHLGLRSYHFKPQPKSMPIDITQYPDALKFYNIAYNVKQFDLDGDFLYLIRNYNLSLTNTALTEAIRSKTPRANNLDIDHKNKIIWYSSRDSLFCQELDLYLKKDSLTNKFPIQEINHLKAINGKTLVGTSKKKNYLCSVDTCISIYPLDGQSINSSKQYEDKIWINSTLGLYFMNLEEEIPNPRLYISYPELLNLPEVKDFEIINDKIIFGTHRGLIEVNKKKIPYKNLKLPLHFIRINGKIVENDVDFIELNHNEDLYLDFVSNSLIPKNNITYQYSFKGKIRQKGNTKESNLNFTSLDHGDYTFTIRSKDKYQNSSDVRSIKIKVNKPFWLEKYFLIPIILIILYGLLQTYYFFIRREKRKARMKLTYAEIELSALQSQMNPHFVFNALNSVQNLVNTNQTALADKYISKFASLLRMYLESSKKKLISLEEEIKIVENYISIEKLRFGDKIEFEIQNRLDKKDLTQKVAVSIIHTFVENAIVHAGFSELNKGKIKIELFRETNNINILIDDNGLGINKTRQKNKNRKRKPRGLQNLRKKIEVINKIHGLAIDIQINDKNDLNLNTNGTLIEIKIPIKKKSN